MRVTSVAAAVVLVTMSPWHATDVAAQPRSETASVPVQHVLVASGQIDPGSMIGGYSGIGLDWIRRAPDGIVVTAGGGSYAVADSRWFLGRFGAAIGASPRVTLSGNAVLGGGTTAGDIFGHRSVRGDVTVRAAPALSVMGSDEYLSVDDAHGHLIRGGAAIRASRSVVVGLTHAMSTGGNLNTSFTMVRADITRRPFSYYGGGAYGQTTPEVLALPGVHETGHDLRQGFFGMLMPVRSAEIGVAIDVLDLSGVTRHTLVVTVSIPVKR